MLEQAEINALRAEPVVRQFLVIERKHVAATNGVVLKYLSPIDGTKLTSLADAIVDDVQRSGFSAGGVR